MEEEKQIYYIKIGSGCKSLLIVKKKLTQIDKENIRKGNF